MTKAFTVNETTIMEPIILSSSYDFRHGSLDALLQNNCKELKSSWANSDESCTASTTLSYEDDSEDQTDSLDMMIEATFAQDSTPVRHVTFANVEIREYNLTIGDHPMTDSYPMSLDWDYTTTPSVPVDQYQTRERNRLNSLSRKIRIALVSGRSLQELTLQEARRVTELTEAEMEEWLDFDGLVSEHSSSFSTPIKTSATLYTLSDKCGDMDVSFHSEQSNRFAAFHSDDDVWVDFDYGEDDDMFEGF
jgi:hypothetical protein